MFQHCNLSHLQANSYVNLHYKSVQFVTPFVASVSMLLYAVSTCCTCASVSFAFEEFQKFLQSRITAVLFVSVLRHKNGHHLFFLNSNLWPQPSFIESLLYIYFRFASLFIVYLFIFLCCAILLANKYCFLNISKALWCNSLFLRWEYILIKSSGRRSLILWYIEAKIAF